VSINEVKDLFEEYIKWLKDKTTLREIEDWVEITTPFLDRHNDYLQIYVKKENNSFVLTDDGYIIDDLRSSGCEIESPRRMRILTEVLNGFGVNLDNDSLIVNSFRDDFPIKKHNLIQSMIAINDLFYTSKPMVASLFLEDVENWLDQSNIRYTSNIKIPGKSGYDRLFNYIIPKSKKQPERILQLINKPDKRSAERVILDYVDIKEKRDYFKFYAVINDSEKDTLDTAIRALQNYEVRPLLWSKREELVDELAA
jgi:hypothetical protein